MAFGEQMNARRPLCLIGRIQTKTHGEQIQDKRFLCLITPLQMKAYGEKIQDKRLQCLTAWNRTKRYAKQIKKGPSVPTCKYKSIISQEKNSLILSCAIVISKGYPLLLKRKNQHCIQQPFSNKLCYKQCWFFLMRQPLFTNAVLFSF